MKKFFDGGEYFVLTSYRIKAVPISDDNEVGLTLAKTICEDACYLSSAGNGQTQLRFSESREETQAAVFIICLRSEPMTVLNMIVLSVRRLSKKVSFRFFISPASRLRKCPLKATESIFPKWMQARSGH